MPVRMSKTFALITLFLFVAILVVPFFAHAQGGGDGRTIDLENPLGENATLCTLFKRVIGFMIWIAAPLVAGMVIYGAYQVMFSKGEPAAIKKGKDTIMYSVIAYVIILFGYGVVSIVQDILGTHSSIC